MKIPHLPNLKMKPNNTSKQVKLLIHVLFWKCVCLMYMLMLFLYCFIYLLH